MTDAERKGTAGWNGKVGGGEGEGGGGGLDTHGGVLGKNVLPTLLKKMVCTPARFRRKS